MSAKHTPGPWLAAGKHITQDDGGVIAYTTAYAKPTPRQLADARLIAAAPEQHAEMLRYLPVLERAEAEPELWERLTAGLGIATLNGYRAAIAKAEGK